MMAYRESSISTVIPIARPANGSPAQPDYGSAGLVACSGAGPNDYGKSNGKIKNNCFI